MLQLLRIQNLAIIDLIEIELGPGLNVLTGETGAGKSILVSALKLVLGGTGRAEQVRSGCDRAEVEALFQVSGDAAMQQRLAEEGIGGCDELLLRRSVFASGRTRAYINGRLATAAQLARLTRGLVDICSQHAHHSLVEPSKHLAYLDNFAGLAELREEVAGAFHVVQSASAALSRAELTLRNRSERQDLLRFQLAELDGLAPEPGELEALEAEARRLRNSERLMRLCGEAEHRLYGGDGAVCEQLSTVLSSLEDALRHDGQLEGVTQRVAAARAELDEAARELGDYSRELTGDSVRLQELDERLFALKRVIRKHGADLQELLSWGEQARAELDALCDGEALVESLSGERSAALARVAELARALSARRHGQAEQLGAAITEALTDLGMGGARVEVEVARTTALKDRSLCVDGAHLTAAGIDRVEFLIAPNPGEPPRPLRQVASGGELSRSLLALKCVLGNLGPSGLYVFDEVDSGVGGAVAEVVGRKLFEVASHAQQVLCITHSPQVTVYADHHFQVRKNVQGGRTRSEVCVLSARARREEVARMLGGIVVTEASRDAARELLQGAAQSRRERGADASC